MRITARLACGTMALVLLTQPALLLAQRQPPETRSGSTERARPARGTPPAPAAQPGPSGPSDPATTKRTWDFFKRLQVPRYNPPGGDCAPAIAAYQQELAGFRSYVDQGLAQPLDPKKVRSERAGALRQLPGLERQADTWLADWEGVGQHRPEGAMGSAAADVCTAQYLRLNLMGLREQLRAMVRIWPDMAEVQPLLSKIEAGLARIGDDRAIERHVAANREGSIKQVRMKPAVATNPVWEGEMRTAFGRLRPGETILKVNLYSAGWYVKKNELTSVPEYRQYGAWIGARRADGTCRIYSLDAFQTYVGGGNYGPSEYRIDSTSGREILCENI